MNSLRKSLILDHFNGLKTLEQVAEEIGISVQRAYQLKQALFRGYRVPQCYWNNGPAVARWVASQDYRNVPDRNTPAHMYYYERWGPHEY